MITMQNKHLKSVLALALLTVSTALQAQSFLLMPSGYFKSQGFIQKVIKVECVSL
ncbi:MAG: hypothetical protein MJZ83_10315 [Bacteroidaceae bacterium]|nr:hypothetical protein [Bacteroidaceae bacterium]